MVSYCFTNISKFEDDLNFKAPNGSNLWFFSRANGVGCTPHESLLRTAWWCQTCVIFYANWDDPIFFLQVETVKPTKQKIIWCLITMFMYIFPIKNGHKGWIMEVSHTFRQTHKTCRIAWRFSSTRFKLGETCCDVCDVCDGLIFSPVSYAEGPWQLESCPPRWSQACPPAAKDLRTSQQCPKHPKTPVEWVMTVEGYTLCIFMIGNPFVPTQ